MNKLTIDECHEIVAYFLHRSPPFEVKRCSAFLDLYQDLTGPRIIQGSNIEIEEDVLESHEHLREVISTVRTNPLIIRQHLIQMCFQTSAPQAEEVQNVTYIIVQLGFMLNCNLKDQCSKNYRVGAWKPSRWEEDETFQDFVSKAIPKRMTGTSEPQQQKDKISAWKLRDRYKIDIRGTDNIAEHLLYDPRTRSLKVFHHTTWLHAQLEKSQQVGKDLDLNGSLMVGILPEQLILETLESFYRILFPLTIDEKGRSRSLLDRLIKDAHFDKHSRSQSYTSPESLEYFYWGDRLRLLAEVATNPPPSNKISSWMERHKAERNILWIAIIGLFLNALFGAGQLIVAIITLKNSPL